MEASTTAMGLDYIYQQQTLFTNQAVLAITGQGKYSNVMCKSKMYI